MEKELQKDRWYVISAATAGTLMLKTDGADIPVEYSAGQTTFYAATGKYECDDASIIISGPFNGAPASVLGGGSTPLSPAEQEAVTNATVGVLKDVTYVPTPAVAATGWVHTEYNFGEFRSFRAVINGVNFDLAGTVDEFALQVQANEAAGVFAVSDGEYVRLTAREAGVAGNSITLEAPYPAKSQVSGDTLTGGEDAGSSTSTKLTVNENGISITNAPAGSVLNTGGLPIDTIGGNVYHRTGSATFAGTEGGHNYAASIDFKHFEVRKNGQLIVHFHESNGEPVLELNGARVLTEAGERIVSASMSGTAAAIEMVHGTYVSVSRAAQSCVITSAASAARLLSMTLEIKPTDVVLPEGWLTAQTEDGTPVTIRWIAGEPTLPATGLTYIIGLTQRTPTLILANLLATY